jgi:hypothetical protein
MMTQIEEFMFLKERAINSYQNYIDTLLTLSYEDLKDMRKRINLLNAYNKSVLSDVSFRTFILHMNYHAETKELQRSFQEI